MAAKCIIMRAENRVFPGACGFGDFYAILSVKKIVLGAQRMRAKLPPRLLYTASQRLLHGFALYSVRSSRNNIVIVFFETCKESTIIIS